MTNQSYYCRESGGTYSKQYAGYDYSRQGQFVPLDKMQPQVIRGQIFQPTQVHTPNTPQPFCGNNSDYEPCLLKNQVSILTTAEKKY